MYPTVIHVYTYNVVRALLPHAARGICSAQRRMTVSQPVSQQCASSGVKAAAERWLQAHGEAGCAQCTYRSVVDGAVSGADRGAGSSGNYSCRVWISVASMEIASLTIKSISTDRRSLSTRFKCWLPKLAKGSRARRSIVKHIRCAEARSSIAQ